MQKWEYRVIGIGPNSAEEKLNELGKEGWEMVAVMASSLTGLDSAYDYSIGGCSVYLKRPKTETSSTLPPIRK